MNIEQHKQKLNKEYNQAIVNKVLYKMWSKLGNELDDVMMSEGYSETNNEMWDDQDSYSGIILNIMKLQCDE